MLAQLDRAFVYGRDGLGFDFSHKKEFKNKSRAISSAG